MLKGMKFFAAAAAVGLGVLSLSFLRGSAMENRNYVAEHGKLSVKDGTLCDGRGEKFQLRGVSSHGLNWYPEFTTREAMQSMKGYGINVFRAAMYTEQAGSYSVDPKTNTERLYGAVDNALSEGLYVIADWHVLREETPLKYKELAKDFFSKLSERYRDQPGLIYEICNEPNGATSWEDIRSYAEEIIPIIRKNSPDALILVGTPEYCANLDGPLQAPLNFPNLMYSMHFYSDCSKDKDYKSVYLEKLIRSGLPIFVSEWGISYGSLDDKHISSSQDSRLSFREASQFLDILKKNNISWCFWSLSNKPEAHSMILPSSGKKSGWEKKDMTPGGAFICGELEKG